MYARTPVSPVPVVQVQHDAATNQALVDSFLGGNAHVYYGLIGIGGLALAILLVPAHALLLVFGVVLVAAVIFVDLWAHGWI